MAYGLSIRFFFFLGIFTCYFAIAQCSGKLGNTKIYNDLMSENICFRRFTKTNQHGCQSSASGNVGTLQFVRNQTEMKLVLVDGEHDPYIAMIYSNHISLEMFKQFQSSDRIAGVIVLHSSNLAYPKGFSDDSSCPNTDLEYYANTEYESCKKLKWNPYGQDNSFLSLDLQFPVFLIKEEQNITELQNCYEKFNHGRDSEQGYKCSAELQARMNGAKDSVTCISRTAREANSLQGGIKFCDPLGSLNIFSTLFETASDKTIESNSLLIVSARLDAATLFEGMSMGADSPLTAVIGLLSTANTLQKYKDQVLNSSSSKITNVLYSFFDGEAFDYIGSGRAVYDLKNDGLAHLDYMKGRELFKGPLYKAEHVNSIIEFGQLNSYDDNPNFYLDVDPITLADPQLGPQMKSLQQKFQGQDGSTSTVIPDTHYPLPPCSIQTFLKHGFKVPSLLIANHKDVFTNHFYHSIFDDAKQIGYQKDASKYVENMKQIVTLTTRGILNTLANSTAYSSLSVDVNTKLITDMAYCFYANISCDFFDYIRGFPSAVYSSAQTFYPLYISVAYPGVVAPHFEYIRLIDRLLVYVSGSPVANVNSLKDCESLRNQIDSATFEWFAGINNTDYTSACYRSTRFATKAISPVFEDVNEPNWNLNYSTYTESVWATPTARIFLAPTPFQEYATLALGLFVFILSIITVRLTKSRCKNVFIGLQDQSPSDS